MKEETIKTAKRNEAIDITENVNAFLKDCCTRQEKALLLFVPHTTAGIFINEGYDPDVKDDILRNLEKMTEGIEFRHSEGNSDGHVKTTLIGNSLTIPVQDGKLCLGKWQRVFFAEFDGPRERKIVMQIL